MEEKNLFFHCTHAADENGAKKEKKNGKCEKIFLKTNLRFLMMLLLIIAHELSITRILSPIYKFRNSICFITRKFENNSQNYAMC